MAKREWLRMVRAGESLTVEFKEKLPKLERLARSFSAFANSTGGTIFFGVDDDGNVVGLESVKGTQEFVEQVSQFHCDPVVPFKAHVWEPVPRAQVLVVEIPEAHQKPVYAVSTKDRKDAWPYFRAEKENLPLDRKSLKAMRHTEAVEITDSEIQHLDRHALNMLNHLAEHPRRTLNQLAKSANIGTHRAKKIIVDLERAGWIHGYFNEKRREYSLVVVWKKR